MKVRYRLVNESFVFRVEEHIFKICSFFLLSSCNYKNENQVKKYIKDKHGFNVVVTGLGGINSGNTGHTYHTVRIH